MDWYWLWYLCEPWVLGWIVSCKTETWEYRLSWIWIDIDYGIHVNLEFLIELYLVRQIPENTDWAVYGLILIMVFVMNLDWYMSKSVYRSSAFTTFIYIPTFISSSFYGSHYLFLYYCYLFFFTFSLSFNTVLFIKITHFV